MMWTQRNCVVFCFLVLYLSREAAEANVVFRFGFDFGLESNETNFSTTLQIGEKSEDHSVGEEASTFTTTAPILNDIWSQQAKLNATANDKLQSTRVVVTQLVSELSDVVGRSDYIATNVKLMTRYLHKANAAFESTAANRFLVLQEFVQLVDDLRVPPGAEVGGERSLDYALMKMALGKYKLIELQTQVLVDVLQAMEVWQTYVQTQMIDLSSV